MKYMRFLFIPTLICFNLIAACSSKSQNQVVLLNPDTDSCMYILKAYGNYWKKDSIGENGFRELLGYRVLMGCNCKGRLWKNVLGYFGSPNFTYTEKDEITYRYRLNHFTNNIKDIGTLLLDIIVDKEGVIISFDVWEVDG